jgi:hypothetical protein
MDKCVVIHLSPQQILGDPGGVRLAARADVLRLPVLADLAGHVLPADGAHLELLRRGGRARGVRHAGLPRRPRPAGGAQETARPLGGRLLVLGDLGAAAGADSGDEEADPEDSVAPLDLVAVLEVE